jgi:hypothetical protein
MTAIAPAGRRRRDLALALALALPLALAACGEAGSTGTTNVQGGTGRAPGAPPVDAQVTPARTSTPTPVR